VDPRARPQSDLGPSSISVDVRDEPSKLAELARMVPTAVRRRPIWIGLWQFALAFMPSPLLLVAFSLPRVAVVWTVVAVVAALILFAVEQEVPADELTPGRVTVDEHGVTIERESKTDHWRSSALRDVQVLDDAIVLLSHRDGWLVIPHASFDSRETRERFIAAARANLHADTPSPGWPKRAPLHLGVIAFLLACAGGLAWMAWDASSWIRLVCAPLAGVCVLLATADMNSRTKRLMGRQPGRPTPPRPGSTTDAYLAAVRIEELRPSALLVLGVYVLATALLYVTLVTEVIGTAIFVSLALLMLAFATFELSNVLEMWWPWRPVRSWRQIEVTSLGVTRRHTGGSETVPWTKLAKPIVRDGAIVLDWPDGESFESIRDSDFARPEDRDAFIAVARGLADR
jgi:hypothetical protein